MRLAAAVPCASLACAVVLACVGSGASPAPEAAAEFQQTFAEQESDFETSGSNPYFILEAGRVLELEGAEERRVHHLTVTVLDQVEKVAGVLTRVVEERETVSGELEEVSRNYFAISKRTHSVYYFGEDVDMYRLGKVHSHEGSWRAGVGGAHYGLFMPGEPSVGMRYFQEVAPDVAMDRAEVVGVGEQLVTPAGAFENVLRVEETTPLEPDAKEYKYFAKGIGLIRDSTLSLVRQGGREGH